ncbi:epithelial splicing regulatory protein 1-like [Ciona intestinalis]
MITRSADQTGGHYCDFLVLFYCGTNGDNSPELLGSDESDLIVIAWQLLDLQQNQTGDIHYICVKSDEEMKNKWKEVAGIDEEVIAKAPMFEDAIQQFEHAVRNELNEKGRTCSFTLCTDGQAHIRQVLMPVSIRSNTQLPDFCYSFFDLKKEFSRNRSNFNPHAMECGVEPYTSVEDMLKYLQVNIKEHDTFGVDHVRRMSSVVQLLISPRYGKFNYTYNTQIYKNTALMNGHVLV